MKSIMVAGTHSGCGKTTATLVLMAGFMERGVQVQGYKVGPDYIDPIWHEAITGRPSKNLDAYFMKENILRYAFDSGKKNADIGIIEGVMGFYDGLKGGYEASSAHVAAVLKTPVILVVNGKGMSLSLSAMIQGYLHFRPGMEIVGVLLNGVREGQYVLCKKQIEENCSVAVLGYIAEEPAGKIPSRHLGLHTDAAKEMLPSLLKMGAAIDFDKIFALAKHWDYTETPPFTVHKTQEVHIAVAKDEAFLFYYHDNLALLEKMGACIHFFSPLKDTALPDLVHGIYIGGGYPEEFGRRLSQNQGMLKAIKRKADAGCPIYAECGGLMYLTERIQDYNGNCWPMTGVLNGHSSMEKKLGPFGYVTVQAVKDNVLAKAGDAIKGHEFHYSRAAVDETESLQIQKGVKRWMSGYSKGNVLGSYVHLHFYANIKWAENFIKRCIAFKAEMDY